MNMLKTVHVSVNEYLKSSGKKCSLDVAEYSGEEKLSLVIDCDETMVSIEVLPDNTCDILIVSADSEEVLFSETKQYQDEKALLSRLKLLVDEVSVRRYC